MHHHSPVQCECCEVLTQSIVPQHLLEEETLPEYEHEQLYPVHIGDIIQARYKVIWKLGYGANSTVWLCRDLCDSDHVVLTLGEVNREKVIYQHFVKLTTSHPGGYNVRQVLDMFDITSCDEAKHFCLVHPPLQTTVFDFQRLGGRAKPLPVELAREIMRVLLETLDFLHTDAKVTHCDLKLSNLMLRVEDETIFDHYEEAERRYPCERKVLNGQRLIYASRPFRPPRNRAYGLPVLCDIGEARIGTSHPYAEIQPEVYKAPEVLMQFDLGPPVDIWNAACILWDMLEVDHLFDGRDGEGYHNNRFHMNEIVNLLGLPPSQCLQRSRQTHRLFDRNGRWNTTPPVRPTSLSDRASHLEGESKSRIFDFMMCMLRWLPEERLNARQLLEHGWLKHV